MESGPIITPVAGPQSSVSGNGHSVYENRTGGARAARERVVSDRRDRAEHVAQVARDGDLLDGVPDLASFHPVAGGPARVVAGNEIHPEPDQLGDEEATTHRPDKAGKVELAALQDQVVIAARAAGGLHSELARGIAAEKIAAQHTAFHYVAVARGDALVVVPRARRCARQMRPLDKGDDRREDFLAETVEQKRSLAVEATPAHRRDEGLEQVLCDGRLEH